MTSKAEYLKRYLSQPDGADKKDKKKKKKSKKSKSKKHTSALQIIDEDIELASLKTQPKEKETVPMEIVSASEALKKLRPNYSDSEESESELVKRAKQLKVEAIDGSGWTTVETVKKEPTSPDNSPMRRRHDSPDNSPVRRRHDSPDNSPVRRRHDSPDNSPVRRRHDSPDNSPVRRRHDSPDNSPVRRRHDSPDNSPVRRRHDSPDNSPVRRRHDSPDNSPVRRRHDSPDNSPVRRRHDSPDNSPPRRKQSRSQSPQRSVKREKRSRSPSPQLTGLQTGAAFGAVVKKKQKEELAKVKATNHGARNEAAATVVRDKQGRKLASLEEMIKRDRGEDPNEADMQWGKGLVQEREMEEKKLDFQHEAAKPLARYADDTDLDHHLRERERWGDPMLNFIKQKKKKKRKKLQQAVQETRELDPDAPVIVPRPMFDGRPWPNRFGILPGYRWDGVDRSNGWETKVFTRMNELAALKQEAHKWSVENM